MSNRYHIDFLRTAFGQMIMYPANPSDEIWVLTGKSNHAKNIFQKGLLYGIHHRSEFDRINPIIFFGDNKRSMRRKRTMQFHDSRRIAAIY